MSGNFQAAYRRAREKTGEAAWALLSDAEREAAVASELRAIEAEQPNKPDEDGKQNPNN